MHKNKVHEEVGLYFDILVRNNCGYQYDTSEFDDTHTPVVKMFSIAIMSVTPVHTLIKYILAVV